MGLFSKFKANMHHGGVTVHIQAPSSIASDQVIPVTVTMTADSAQNISSVKAEIKAKAREQGMNIGMGTNNGMNNMNNQQTAWETISQAESRDPITIAPGETKTVQLQLYLNGGAAGQMPQMPGTLGGIVKALTAFDHVNYTYEVHASADVEGITLDPSDKQPLQVLPPSGNPAATAPQSVAPVTPEAAPERPAAEAPIVVPGVITPNVQPPAAPQDPTQPQV